MLIQLDARMVLIAMAVLIAICSSAAAVPVTQSITYQGKLTNAAGSPLTGTYPVTFNLYDAGTGGTALSADTHGVTAANGLFTTSIAVTNPAIVDGRALWLGTRVGTDPEMTPRQEIRTVPYALGLRPGARISGTVSTASLILANAGGGEALSASASGNNIPCFHATSAGDYSAGIRAETGGFWSYGVIANTTGDRSTGLFTSTEGDGSDGLSAETAGAGSRGVVIRTLGVSSAGVHVVTGGESSSGISSRTSGAASTGIFSSTGGDNSHAIWADTEGNGSDGIMVTTMGGRSHGVAVITSGGRSEGINVTTVGLDSHGITVSADEGVGIETNTYSSNVWYTGGSFRNNGAGNGLYGESAARYGIVGNTNRPDQKYGIYTDDYLYAKGTQVPSSDIAEYMPVSGEVTPGTVLVIGKGGVLSPSSAAYDTRVAGIVSAEPGVSLGAKEEGNPGEAVVAVAGRVPCRVDASYGAIAEGDLLGTSDTPGYAMKAEPVTIDGIKLYRPGTILGKAMESLDSGTGTIEVLVTLQ